MTDTDRFETRLATWMEARADLAVRPFDAVAVAHSAVTGPRGRRRAWDVVGAWAPTPRLARVFIVVLLIGLLAVGAALVGSQLLKPSPDSPIPADRGTFTPTGPMAVARLSPTATLLRDGRVLVVGGRHGPLVPSAEIWDPVTGAFSPTGSLAGARAGHTATLLRDGRVLVVGSTDPGVPSAEIWDPATGTFSPAASPAVDRSGATARLLPDGRVLVTGGFSYDADGNGVPATSAEAWDPGTDTWSQADSLPEASYPAGTLLDDGRILVISEGEGLTAGYGSATVWDPATGLSSPTGPFERGIASGTATRLSDGRVLFAGGGWWQKSCVSSTPRPDGSCAGISAYDFNPITAAAIWDASTGLFGPTGSLAPAIVGPAATGLLDGRILVVGEDSAAGTGSAELFELK
jgi:hypothetical protein